MSVLCGNRKAHSEPVHHNSVSEVRECFASLANRPVKEETETPSLVLDGTYTVVHPDGSHTTLRLKTQSLTAKFAPGEQVASFLSGPDNTSDYTSFAFIKSGRPTIWRRFQTDSRLVEALVSAIKREPGVLVSGTCFRCGRELTTPESLASGFGKICREKGLRG